MKVGFDASFGGSELLESVNEWDPLDLPSCEYLYVTLRRLFDERSGIVGQAFSESVLEHLLITNNAVESIFLGLRESGRLADLDRLEPLRCKFYENPGDDHKIMALLTTARFEDPHEASRTCLMRNLARKLNSQGSRTATVPTALDSAAMSLQSEQQALIRRVAGAPLMTSAYKSFLYMMATIDSRIIRAKLATAWDSLSQAAYTGLRDGLVGGMAGKKAPTLPSGFHYVGDMLWEFVCLAMVDQTTLLRSIDNPGPHDPGLVDSAFVDLPHFVRRSPGFGGMLYYDIDMSLQYISSIVQRMLCMDLHFDCIGFGLYNCRIEDNGTHLTTVRVDLNDRQTKRHKASYTQPIRNGAATDSWSVLAYSYISCRALKEGCSDRIGFQHIVSILHELGHAIQHALPKHPLPNLSGLEECSTGRSESFSLWLEKGALLLPGLELVSSNGSVGRSRVRNAVEQRLSAFSRGVYALIELVFDYGTASEMDALFERFEALQAPYVHTEIAVAILQLVDRIRSRRAADSFRYIQAGVESTSLIMHAAGRSRDVGLHLALRPWQDGSDILGHPSDYFEFYRGY